MMSSTSSMPTRQADEVGRDACGLLLFGGELAMRGAGGVDNQRLGVADVRQV
jgi:hypothetical protein